MVKFVAVLLAGALALFLTCGLYLLTISLFSWPVMWAWNCFAVYAFGLPELGYWHSFSMLFLLGIVSAVFRPHLTAKGK